ncbi:HepT-like ribonuclease domain-containing protein [Brevibacterium sp. CSND-B09]|uniref:HepT-like ribonuclease domain-containing protein n=1 Tax=Brevibacterium sp. CSND-B09 TaxID=3462571 RepID=UPI00406A1DE9
MPGLERIVGLRNVLAHEYGDINYEILWLATTTEIPGLITILNELVDEARDATGL